MRAARGGGRALPRPGRFEPLRRSLLRTMESHSQVQPTRPSKCSLQITVFTGQFQNFEQISQIFTIFHDFLIIFSVHFERKFAKF